MAQSPELKALSKQLSAATTRRRKAQYTGDGNLAALMRREAEIRLKMRKLVTARRDSHGPA